MCRARAWSSAPGLVLPSSLQEVGNHAKSVDVSRRYENRDWEECYAKQEPHRQQADYQAELDQADAEQAHTDTANGEPARGAEHWDAGRRRRAA